MNVQIGYGYSVWTAVSTRTATTAAPASQTPAPTAPPAGTTAEAPAHCHCPTGPAPTAVAGYRIQAYLVAVTQPAGAWGQPSLQPGAPAQPGTAAPAQDAPAAGGHVVRNPTNAMAGAGGAPAGAPVSAADPQQPAPPATQAADAPPADESQPEHVPAERAKLSIDRLDTANFQDYRLKQLGASLETSLKLELETREGDRIMLDFSQLDVREQARLRGRGEEGERVRMQESSESTRRLVNIAVEGELSEAERAAIDEVLDAVLASAREFFGGSFEQAAARLQDMAFDTATLLDFSLEMTQTRTIAATRSYGPWYATNRGDALHGLAERDGGVSKVLEFFADTQRRLVEAAQDVLDDPSAAKAVRGLLPRLLEAPVTSEQPMLDAPLAELSGKVAGTA